MLIDPCAAFAFVAVVLNVVGVTIHRVNNPVKPFGKKFFKSSTTWIQQQTRLLISYTKRRASKPTSSATEPFVTPSQRRRTTRARFPPPAPTPIRQLTVQPIVIDLVAQCRPHVAQLQLPLAFSPLVYDEFDVAERSLSLRGPTSLDLYTASAVCSILLPFVSTPGTLSPATPRLALPDGSPDQGDAWALEFSWFGAAVSLVLVLLALHNIFPSKGQQTRCSRTARVSKAARKSRTTRWTVVSGTAVAPSSWSTTLAQPALEAGQLATGFWMVTEFNVTPPPNVKVDMADDITSIPDDASLSQNAPVAAELPQVLDALLAEGGPLPKDVPLIENTPLAEETPIAEDIPLVKSALLAEGSPLTGDALLTEDASAAEETPRAEGTPLTEGHPLPENIPLAGDIPLSEDDGPALETKATSDPDGEGWIKVQRKPKERLPTSVPTNVPTNQPRLARTQRRKTFLQPWSEHRAPPKLKNSDLATQRRNEELNRKSVVQQVGSWKVPSRPEGSPIMHYRFPKAYPPLNEITPSTKSAGSVRMLGPKRWRYVPGATFVGGPSRSPVGASKLKRPTPRSPPAPSPSSFQLLQKLTRQQRKEKHKRKAQGLRNASKPLDDCMDWEDTVYDFYLAAASARVDSAT